MSVNTKFGVFSARHCWRLPWRALEAFQLPPKILNRRLPLLIPSRRVLRRTSSGWLRPIWRHPPIWRNSTHSRRSSRGRLSRPFRMVLLEKNCKKRSVIQNLNGPERCRRSRSTMTWRTNRLMGKRMQPLVIVPGNQSNRRFLESPSLSSRRAFPMTFKAGRLLRPSPAPHPVSTSISRLP